MLIMAHIFIGLILGLILGKIFHDNTAIIWCVIGSILPDAVKLLDGYFFSGSLLRSARFFSQTLALFLLFLVLGIIIWRSYRSNAGLCLAAGIFLHAVADLWNSPDWHFSLFEPFVDQVYRGNFHGAVWREAHFLLVQEITSISEWVFFLAVAGITLCLLARKNAQEPGKETPGKNGVQ
jgi:membrane-bound metal-dependent hydrolase YbcI (DUF457 family)